MRSKRHTSFWPHTRRRGYVRVSLFSRLLVVFFLLSLAWPVDGQQTTARRVRNGQEVYREIVVAPDSVREVHTTFPTFQAYQDLVLFHPTFGYYSSGRVSFSDDYQTFPIVLAPAFGNMLAEHLFRMWDGMRQSGALNDKETFTIGEFGAGNGAMAESILDYIQTRAASQVRWAAFASQAVYVCYDRSPALNTIQQARNERFGARFDARLADATNLTATIRPGSIKGVVLSNELPDAFSVHKVMLTTSDAPLVAYVAPSVSAVSWRQIRALVPPVLAADIEAGDLSIEKTYFSGVSSSSVFLSTSNFSALLDTLVKHGEYATVVGALQFNEIYVPAATIPELAAHLRRHARVYAEVLARDNDGILTYINLGVEKMIQGSAEILAAGYVITIDYGSSWSGILSNDGSKHLRTYGPAHRAASSQANVAESDSVDNVQTSDPYDRPTLNDLTTDVNFSLLDVEGRQAGLRTLFYGSQKALQSGTGISLDDVPERAYLEHVEEKFLSWASDFLAPSVYKVMVQQKQGTDPRYRFPDEDPEPLESSSAPLTTSQRELAAAIEKRLGGG